MTDTTVANTPAATTEPADKFEYDENREFFAPDKLPDAQEYAGKIAAAGIAVHAYSEQWPDGAGAAILPLTRTIKKPGEETGKRKLLAVMVWPVWPPEAFNASEAGQEYIRDVVYAEQAATILNNMRRQQWEKGQFDLSNCPKSLQEHIEGKAADRGAIKSYTEAAKAFIAAIRKQHPKQFGQFTPALLRQYLQDASMARSFAPALEAKGFFVSVIDKLEAYTKAAGGNIEVYQRWRDTRNEAADVDMDIDIASLSLDAPAPATPAAAPAVAA